VPLAVKMLDRFRPDQPAASGNQNLHRSISLARLEQLLRLYDTLHRQQKSDALAEQD
jgi:hypothetical protein